MLSLFYGPPDPVTGYPATTLTPEWIEERAEFAAANLFAYGTFFGEDFLPGSLSTKWARSFYNFGFPQPGFDAAGSECAPCRCGCGVPQGGAL